MTGTTIIKKQKTVYYQACHKNRGIEGAEFKFTLLAEGIQFFKEHPLGEGWRLVKVIETKSIVKGVKI